MRAGAQNRARRSGQHRPRARRARRPCQRGCGRRCARARSPRRCGEQRAFAAGRRHARHEKAQCVELPQAGSAGEHGHPARAAVLPALRAARRLKMFAHGLSSADSSQQRLRLAQIAGTMPLGEPKREFCHRRRHRPHPQGHPPGPPDPRRRRGRARRWAMCGSDKHYSITSSTRSKNCSETCRPRARAVVRLSTSSNLVGCSTGMSPGFVPCRIRCT